MAGSDSDDPGVLGNLPRSRPGRRSTKRASAGSSAAKATSTPKATGTSGRKSGSRPSTARKAPSSKGAPSSATSARSEPPPRRAPAQQPGDPLSQAVRLAGKVAETGVKTGAGILRRLSGR